MRGDLKLTTRLVLAISAIAPLCSGCIIPRCDVAPQHRGSAYQNVGIVPAPHLVNIEVEFRGLGRNWRYHAERMRPGVVRGLTASKVFIEADDTNRDRAGKLHVVVYEDVDPKKLVELFAKGAVNGISYGLVSTTSEAYYDMDITYTPPNGNSITWTGHQPYTLISGLKSWEKSEHAVPVRQVPVELSEGMAAKFAQDFCAQNAGAEVAMAVAPATNQVSASMLVTRLPPPTIAPEVTASASVIQSAAAISPTPTIPR